MAHAQVRIPRRLAGAFDSYFQTSRFAQANFIKFNKELVIKQINSTAERHGLVLDEEHALGPKFKGTFKLSGGKKKQRMLRVSAASLPHAEDWTVPA